jgi:TolA-binding protein
MSDPTRLLELGADEFEASLLRAGRSDAMPAQSRRQILAGIGIGGLLGASTVASGVRAAAKGWFAKATLGVASALTIWAGVRATHPSPPATEAAPVAVAPRAPARNAAPRPAAAPAEEPAAAPEPAAAERSKAPAVNVPRSALASNEASLRQELGAIEQARRAFLAHDYTQSLRLLDEYTRKFPKRQLGSEATVLRIEALAARGDRDTASRIGHDFLQSHPNGPYAQRVRSVIGDGTAH